MASCVVKTNLDAGDDDFEVEADFEKEMKLRIETTTNDDIEEGCSLKNLRKKSICVTFSQCTP